MDDFLIEIDEKYNVNFLVCNAEKSCKTDSGNLLVFGKVLSDADIMKKIEANHKQDKALSENISGNFVLCYQKDTTKEFYLVPDYMGGHVNVYFLRYNSNYYIASSIKLFSKIGFKKQMNYAMVDEFVYNGVIKTRDTLICGIYKLLSGEYIYIDSKQVEIKQMQLLQADTQDISIEELYNAESSVVNEYIDKCKNISGVMNITLSGGYDSNFILHLTKKRGIKPIEAYTCGGSRGADETGIAQGISEIYGDVSLHREIVDKDILKSMDEIASRLEGSLYERGIYMQYFLARTLCERGVTSILLGECADQIFNENFYKEASGEFLMNYIDNPRELGTMLVLKKSILMLQSFGITGFYPFTDYRMRKLGSRTASYNETSKKYQKKMCDAYFLPEVAKLVGKKPGSTSLAALFEDEEEEKQFIEYVQKTNEFYKPDFRISFKYGEKESVLDYYLCLEYLRSFKKVFCDA